MYDLEIYKKSTTAVYLRTVAAEHAQYWRSASMNEDWEGAE